MESKWRAMPGPQLVLGCALASQRFLTRAALGGQSGKARVLGCLTRALRCRTASTSLRVQALPVELKMCGDQGNLGTPNGVCYSTITSGQPPIVFNLQQAGKGVDLAAALAFPTSSCVAPGAAWHGPFKTQKGHGR